MPYEFVSSVNAVARQQQLWGVLIGGIGLAIIIFALVRDKGMVLSLIGLALIGTGGFYLYQSLQLRQSGGEWRISIDQGVFDWQSPNQQVDPSFRISVADIDFIDRGARSTASDEQPRYHLVMLDDGVIRLREISGIDLTTLVHQLEQQGVEVKETGQFYNPVELRNR